MERASKTAVVEDVPDQPVISGSTVPTSPMTSRQSEAELVVRIVKPYSDADRIEALRAIGKLSIKRRLSVLPRGTAWQAAPAQTGQVAGCHIGEILYQQLTSQPKSEVQAAILEALAEWGGTEVALYLFDNISQFQRPESQRAAALALSVIGGIHSISALILAGMIWDLTAFENIKCRFQELATGGSTDRSWPEPIQVPHLVTNLLRAIPWKRIFSRLDHIEECQRQGRLKMWINIWESIDAGATKTRRSEAFTKYATEWPEWALAAIDVPLAAVVKPRATGKSQVWMRSLIAELLALYSRQLNAVPVMGAFSRLEASGNRSLKPDENLGLVKLGRMFDSTLAVPELQINEVTSGNFSARSRVTVMRKLLQMVAATRGGSESVSFEDYQQLAPLLKRPGQLKRLFGQVNQDVKQNLGSPATKLMYGMTRQLKRQTGMMKTSFTSDSTGQCVSRKKMKLMRISATG